MDKGKKVLSLENYIFDLIEKREYDLKMLEKEKENYSAQAYWCLFYRYHGALSDLYMSLTAFNNPLSQIHTSYPDIRKNKKDLKRLLLWIHLQNV